MAAIDAYRSFSYEVAETIAPTWESRRPEIERIATPVRAWMLGELAPEPGHTVLELAAGTGDTGFDVAERLGENGRLISSDFSPAMLETARRRGAELGIKNVDYRVLDAERIELKDDSVDGVLCRFGYMFVADPAAAFAESRRVLRPGGRLALAVWGSPERNPFFAMIGISLVQRGHLPAPEPPPAPGIFAMASAERTTDLLARAGFTEVRTEDVAVCFTLPDADEYLNMVADTAGPLALALRGLSDAERAAVKTDIDDGFSRFAADDGYEVPGVALCAVAR
ncbi:MAG: class I SAM-dependent methyltransferase [Actinomycetota bacterium]